LPSWIAGIPALRRWDRLVGEVAGKTTGNGDNQTAGASFRVVMDLANWDGAMVTNTPGQSGDPRSPFYSNLFGPWARGEYAPLPYSPAAVKARTAETVVLVP
jgi:penicillin amidase